MFTALPFELTAELLAAFNRGISPGRTDAGCRLWLGRVTGAAKNTNGHKGTMVIAHRGRQVSARRVAYAIKCGTPPRPEQVITASCKLLRCVAPEHMVHSGDRTPAGGTRVPAPPPPSAPTPPPTLAGGMVGIEKSLELIDRLSTSDVPVIDAEIERLERRVMNLKALRGIAVNRQPQRGSDGRIWKLVPFDGDDRKSLAAVAVAKVAKPKPKPAKKPTGTGSLSTGHSSAWRSDVRERIARHIADAGRPVDVPRIATALGASPEAIGKAVTGSWFFRTNTGDIDLTPSGRVAALAGP